MKRVSVLLALAAILLTVLPALAYNPDVLVSVGSPPTPFSQNKQNEPAIAVDANHPTVLASGSNDEIDMEACNAGSDTNCPFTPGVGVSGIYFSFDSGTSWIQPTYTGLTGRFCLGTVGDDPGCTPEVGPIGTLPWYYEAGLVSDGDPALAFGPIPGPDGSFSWDNGSRLYYANLTSNLSAQRSEEAFKGFEAVAVSRIDGAPELTAEIVADQNNWMPPVIVTKQNAALFSDKEQIWADNASSSPYFGNVYICNAAFRGAFGHGNTPVPITVSYSKDGGNTWKTKMVTNATSNIQQGFKTGCTLRTDSNGVVYMFYVNFGVGSPGIGHHMMVKSLDGGHTWTRPKPVVQINDACYYADPLTGRCTEDGVAGARMDLAPAPAVDIANGSPTGADATNEIVDTWVDGRFGFNNEKVMLISSTNKGRSWTAPRVISEDGDRGYYAAPGISPNGTDLYVVYNAFTTPFRDNTTDPRELVGVVLHADVAASGAVGDFTELHRSPPGDPRTSSQNNLVAEFLGDYVYATATRTYGAVVWNDVRNGAVCPAINDWRMSLELGNPIATPAPQQDCPATWGNSDIYGGSYPDPTP